MPIYEFACSDCRRVFQFFFRSAASRRRPACPLCGRKGLSRRLSRFAVTKDREKGRPDGVEPPGPGDAAMERALARLESEMDGVDEEDPRAISRVMRRAMKESGADLGPEMEEALRRLEAGEDPEKIEEEMGDLLDDPGAEGGADWEYDDGLYEP